MLKLTVSKKIVTTQQNIHIFNDNKNLITYTQTYKHFYLFGYVDPKLNRLLFSGKLFGQVPRLKTFWKD